MEDDGFVSAGDLPSCWKRRATLLLVTGRSSFIGV